MGGNHARSFSGLTGVVRGMAGVCARLLLINGEKIELGWFSERGLG
jgi:hypothetical protein